MMLNNLNLQLASTANKQEVTRIHGKIGGNSLKSFLSSVFLPDLFNRAPELSFDSALNIFNGKLGSIFMNLRFSLPAQNALIKFKNRAHFIIYLLMFESIALQRPVVRPFVKKHSSSTSQAGLHNKRALKKQLHEGSRIDGYTFSASVSNDLSLHELIRFFSFFVAPHTEATKTVPSRFINLKVEPSLGVVSFKLMGLAGLPFGFVSDDLDSSFVELEFFWCPIKAFSKKNSHLSLNVTNNFKVLNFIARGLGGFVLADNVRKIVDLRVSRFL